MASMQDDIELRHRSVVRKLQRPGTFPTDGRSPQDVTRTRPIENSREYRTPPPHASQPNDIETALDSPLLLNPERTSRNIDEGGQSSSIDRAGNLGRPRDAAEHPPSHDATSGVGCPEDQKERDSDKLTPKNITRTGWDRYRNGWTVHMPALLVTGVVLGIGSRKFYWYPESGPLIRDYRVDPDVVSNVLQLAAKVHELLIVASLSSIALAMFRRCLVTSGVRLGFLTGGYRVGDLAYIGTAAFWRQGLDISNPWGLLLPGFVVFATLMSTIVGPASAVLLAPTLGWYDIDASIAFSNVELPLRYWWNKTNIWSINRLDAPPECLGVEGIYEQYCPAGGFQEILSWLRDFAATDLTNNLTFHSTSADLRRHLVFTQANDTQGSNSTTLCTTPPHFLTNSIGLFQKYIDSSNVGALSGEPRYRLRTTRENPTRSSGDEQSILYQPFIQSKCTIYDKEELKKDTSPIFYPVEALNCFGNVVCLRNKADGVPFDKTWMANDKLDNASISSTFLTTKSPIVLIYGHIPDASLGDSEHIVYMCSLLASLAPSNFSVDAQVSDLLQSSRSHTGEMRKLYQEGSPDKIQTFIFSDKWFSALNPTWSWEDASNPDDRKTYNIRALRRIVQTFSSKHSLKDGTFKSVFTPVDRKNNAAVETFLAKVFGVYLTEGLARSTYQHPNTQLVLKKNKTQIRYINLNEQYGFSGGIHELNWFDTNSYSHTWGGGTTNETGTLKGLEERLESKLKIHLVAERYGYGSGQERRTLQWAQVTMCIYLGVVVIYASCVGFVHSLELSGFKLGRVPERVLSIKPWSDLQDLIILALKTPIPSDRDLADAGAGVSSSKVWEKPVCAGSDEGSNAQLLFGKASTANKLDLGPDAQYY